MTDVDGCPQKCETTAGGRVLSGYRRVTFYRDFLHLGGPIKRLDSCLVGYIACKPENVRANTSKGGSYMRRMIVAAAALAALATPASVIVVGGSGVAGATPKSLVCSSVSGKDTSTVTISKCAVPAADSKTYASASGKATSLEKGGTITWTSSKKTTILKLTVKGSSGCASGDLTEKATGSVTGGTASTAVTSKGQAVSLTVCINKAGTISLKPGTKADI